MNHNEFIAEVGYEDGDRLMHGSVINTRAVLHFEGGNIEELRQAFADTIARRKWCKRRGVERKTLPGRAHCASPRSCVAASPKRPRGCERASISSSSGASKRWPSERDTRG